MNSIAPITPDYFSVTDTSVRTTSLKVAEAFGKHHHHVLSKLKALDCSPEFTATNFRVSEYSDTTGRSLPMYEMTKDGFMFLVMGFTGEKAAAIKEAYIVAFNQMADELSGKKPKQLPATRPEVIRCRDDLSFTVRDAEERLINWKAPRGNHRYWHDDIVIGQSHFAEVVELSEYDEAAACEAIHYALVGSGFEHGMNTEFCGAWGIEEGFARAVAQAAIMGIRAKRYGAEPFDRDKPKKSRKKIAKA